MARTVKLNTGAEMPTIALGTWKSPVGQTGQAVKAAIRAGYRNIDCANDYGNEAEIGATLKELFESGEVSPCACMRAGAWGRPEVLEGDPIMWYLVPADGRNGESATTSVSVPADESVPQ